MEGLSQFLVKILQLMLQPADVGLDAETNHLPDSTEAVLLCYGHGHQLVPLGHASTSVVAAACGMSGCCGPGGSLPIFSERPPYSSSNPTFFNSSAAALRVTVLTT